MSPKNKQPGFTIVELFIVIVVIAILAAITIVTYSGIKNRAQDSRRLQDVQSIVAALDAHKILIGTYPNPIPNDPSGWEVSKNTPESFLSALKSSGTLTSLTPVDPINSGNNMYKYYKYPAGNAGCDVARGDFYILAVQTLSSKSGNGHGPGFSCSGRDWGLNEGAWVTGSYTN